MAAWCKAGTSRHLCGLADALEPLALDVAEGWQVDVGVEGHPLLLQASRGWLPVGGSVTGHQHPGKQHDTDPWHRTTSTTV